jgi:hypothetical protein
MTNKLMKYIVAACLIMATSIYAFSEDYTIKYIGHNEVTGSFDIEINGTLYKAISIDDMKRIREEAVKYAAAQKELELQKQYNAALEKPIEKIDAVLKAKNDYIKGLEEQIETYKKLVENYKKIKTDSWLKLELGGGFTGNFNPAAIGGISIFGFSILGFVQENTPGCFIGFEIPIL